MGRAFRKVGRFQDAIAEGKKAIALEPNFVGAWHGLGNSYYESNDFVSAEKCYRKMLELDPNSYEGRENLGESLVSQGRFKEARFWFNKAKTCPKAKDFPGEIDAALKNCDEKEKASAKSSDTKTATPKNSKDSDSWDEVYK